MVNFIMVVDADDERRLSYVKSIEPRLSPVEGLLVSSCSTGDFSATWAAGTWTPVSYEADSEGAGIVFGDAIRRSQRLDAEQLRDWWNRSRPPEALDGFHAAAMYDSEKGLIVGADLLGLFPIYHYATEEVTLVGSSPELFKYHPCFQMKFNPRGLVGILLTKGIFEGQTLFCGVNLLAAGHLLLSRYGEPAKEVLQYRLPVSTQHFDLSISEQVELLDQALEEAISRHVPKGDRYCLMLSGGLDSRLVGGYLQEKGSDIIACTEGLPTDNDIKVATPVANMLGFNHTKFNIGYSAYPHFADLAVTWQHLFDGFTGLMFWGFHRHLRKLASRVISGFMGDGILGNLINRACSKPACPQSLSFETFFNYLNRWAFTPETLTKLLKKNIFEDLVPEVLARIKKVYESYPGLEFQRVWGFGINHRLRFHDGSGVWLLSFGSWPVLPFADHKILETLGGMPITALIERRVERELLRKKFPELARIPLSGNTYDTKPLFPRPRPKGLHQVFTDQEIWRFRPARQLRNMLRTMLKGERRYWMRVSHFNNPGWKAVRKMAEPYLKLTSTFLDKNMVRELLPPSNSPYLYVRWIITRKGILETSSLRTLLGIILWLRKNDELTVNLDPVQKQYQ